MDPMLSLIMESTFEAVLDAGYHPSDFAGTRTGVFVGSCLSEIEILKFSYNLRKNRTTVLM